jgi:hypothetical protein
MAPSTRVARIVGICLGTAVAASSVVLAARSFRVDELDPRAPPARIAIALDYWEHFCEGSRPFHTDAKLKRFRERLQMSIGMEMREDPPMFESQPADVELCINEDGHVLDVKVVPSRTGVKWKADIQRAVRSWRYAAGEAGCFFERLRVSDVQAAAR